MITYPDIDPIAFSLGPLAIRWYGISYLVGFLGAFAWCTHHRDKVSPNWKIEEIADLLFYIALGVIFGGTVGYILFYQPHEFLANPLVLLKFWEPGRSFHGGLLGVLLAVGIFARIKKRKFWAVCDFIAPAIPLGLAAGRIGNFLNAELWGRVTSMPWGMVFPGGGPFIRHPSQLYEFLLEGVALFLLLAWYSRKPRAIGKVSGLFLIGYGCFRIFVEFFREPDASQGFIFGDFVTMGQLLSLPMILAGLVLMNYSDFKQSLQAHRASKAPQAPKGSKPPKAPKASKASKALQTIQVPQALQVLHDLLKKVFKKKELAEKKKSNRETKKINKGTLECNNI